jgi:Beta/Gamma crystallin
MFVLGQAFSQYVVLYQDCYYRGKSKVLFPGRHNLSALGFSGQVSSAKVPPGLKLVLYEDPNGSSGAKTRFTSDVSCLGGDWNDRAQFVLIESDNTGGNQYQPEQSRPVYPSYGSNGAQVVLYEDCSLRGRSVALAPGNYHTRELGISNDALSSIRIPKGYSVVIYKDNDFRGQSQTFYSTVYCLDGNWSDQASSIIVYGPGGSHNSNSSASNNYYYNDNNSYSGSRDMVTFYADCNYGGASFSMPVGNFKERSIKVGNDKISSFRVPYGFRLTVYQNDGFGGRSRTFTGSVKCLDGTWNDQISSFIIEGPGSTSGNVDFFNNHNQDNNYHNYSPNVSYGESYDGVTVYYDSWYKGNHQVYNPGSYDLRYSTLKNNISSLAIQPGYRVVVYEDYGYKGRSQTFTASVPNLSSYGWNDNIRSIRVYRY